MTDTITIEIRDILAAGVQESRAHEKGVEVRSTKNGGGTYWESGKVRGVAAPTHETALARTIRIHELLHANQDAPPCALDKRWPEIVVAAVDDAIVHSQLWDSSKMPDQANRDCLSVGLREMRSIPPLEKLGRIEDYNQALHSALRSMAVVEKLSGKGRPAKRQRRALKQLRRKLTPTTVNLLKEVMRSHRDTALALFSGMLRRKPEPVVDKQPKDRKGKFDGELDVFRELGEPGSGDKLGGSGASGSHGAKGSKPAMAIVRPPLVEDCTHTMLRHSLGRSGPRINRSALSRIIANRSSAGAFRRTKYLPGGCFVIDASGSMDMDDERLQAICNAVPAATVVYYSGGDGCESTVGKYGDLVIYAEGGKRAAKIVNHHGGNDVDEDALRWLLQQPGPRTFVSDGDFCGGVSGQGGRCAKLLAEVTATGQVTWERTIDELEIKLGLRCVRGGVR